MSRVKPSPLYVMGGERGTLPGVGVRRVAVSPIFGIEVTGWSAVVNERQRCSVVTGDCRAHNEHE